MKPTHRLKMLDKITEEKGSIGAGWLNKDGSISIVLDPFVVIKSSDKDRVYTLFPIHNKVEEEV